MIFGMCRYIFVGFHMDLVLKCAKNIVFFFLRDNWNEVALNKKLVVLFGFPLRENDIL